MSCSFGSCLVMHASLLIYYSFDGDFDKCFFQVSLAMFLFGLFFKHFGHKPIFGKGAQLEMFRKQHE